MLQKLIILVWGSLGNSWHGIALADFSFHLSTLQHDYIKIFTGRTKGMLNCIINLRISKVFLPYRKSYKTNYSFDNCRTFNFVLIYWELLSEQKETEDNSNKPIVNQWYTANPSEKRFPSAKLEGKGNFPCFNISPPSSYEPAITRSFYLLYPRFIFWWPENFAQSSLSKQILLQIVFWTCKHRKEASNNLHSHFPTFRRLTRKRKQASTVVLQTYKSVCHLMRTPI